MKNYRIVYLPAGAFGFLVGKNTEVIKAYLKRGLAPTFTPPGDPELLVIAAF